MTQEEKDIIECAADDVHRVSDTLEAAEINLRDLGNIKADETDPYSTTTDYAADKIYSARDALDQAAELLKDLCNAEVTQKEESAQ